MEKDTDNRFTRISSIVPTILLPWFLASRNKISTKAGKAGTPFVKTYKSDKNIPFRTFGFLPNGLFLHIEP